MSEKEQRAIFSKNLNAILEKRKKSQREVAEAIGVSPQTFNTWCKGIALPRMGKIQRLADYLNVPKSRLIDEHDDGYYFNDDTAEIAQAIKDSEELRLLFDESRDAPPEDIKVLYDMLLALKRKEQS